MAAKLDTVTFAAEAILGAALVVPQSIDTVSLRPEDFADQWHGQVWGWIQGLRGAGRSGDPIAVAEYAIAQGVQESDVGFQTLVDLANSCPGVSGLAGWVEILRAHAKRRRAVQIARELLASAEQDESAISQPSRR